MSDRKVTREELRRLLTTPVGDLTPTEHAFLKCWVMTPEGTEWCATGELPSEGSPRG